MEKVDIMMLKTCQRIEKDVNGIKKKHHWSRQEWNNEDESDARRDLPLHLRGKGEELRKNGKRMVEPKKRERET